MEGSSDLIKRGPYSKKYTEKNVQDALIEIESGSINVFGASKKFNIPDQTV
jgi:hypothetical protein